MPEYLSPGVYVEEIDTGSKPIEGVSTSTSGMLGVTERGPVNVPILITSFGQFTRWFGGILDIDEFTNDNGQHCYLPHAVEGFFTNGGKRVFITRVLPAEAAPAELTLFDRGTLTSANTVLLRPAAAGSGSGINPPRLYVLDPGNLAVNDRIRVGDGSQAEYHQVTNVGAAANNTHVSVSFPLSLGHAVGSPINQIARTANLGFTLANATAAGSTTITLIGPAADITTLVGGGAGQLIEIGTANNGEHRFSVEVTDLGGGQARVRLDSDLAMAYAAGTVVTTLLVGGVVQATSLTIPANAADLIVFVDDRNGQFIAVTALIIIESGVAGRQEVRRIGELDHLPLAGGAYEPYPARTLIQQVSLLDDDRELTAASAAGDTTITVNDVTALAPGQEVTVGAGGVADTAVIDSIDTVNSRVTLRTALANAHASGEPIVLTAKQLSAATSPGDIIVLLNNRLGLAISDVLRIGVNPDEEFATIAAITGSRGPAPDAGSVVLTRPLFGAHANNAQVHRQHPPALAAAHQVTFVVLPVEVGAQQILVNDGHGYTAGDFIQVTMPTGGRFYHRLAGNAAAAAPVEVEIGTALTATHEAGSPVAERAPLILVQALDAGSWGNRLRIAVQDEPMALVASARLSTVSNATQVRLSTATGVEAGTVLQLFGPVPDDGPIGELLKVVSIDRTANNLITLAAPGLSAAQMAAHNAAAAAGQTLRVRSQEIMLTVYLMRRLDPAVPTRSDTVLDSEIFRYLSMDPRHSRYVHKVIGTTWKPSPTQDDDDGKPLRLDDRRSEGESRYVRARDLAQHFTEPQRTTTLQSVRPGPEALVDLLRDGRPRAARHALMAGNDSVTTLNDDNYIGIDDPEPFNRTGLNSLRNEEEISIVACPGRTSAGIQGALIDHCEFMRYRFAVLDARRSPNDSLNDVQVQRQQYDTKYAAIYHPWTLIPDPSPTNLAAIQDYPIPPSGHVMGIYARTDNERGVHKAPANEVVRGVTGLQRILNKGEQDILNPFPVNINVIRDFNNRGIRVWGGRVITSDPDWKYVNVRRLMIFIEASIDRGLQWVVFEPNAEPLWARVNRTVSNFLSSVWRDGGLEGTKPEEAYFVKVDRTTMTQTDIDNGRLIVVIGVAPVKPAEFVIIRIGLWTAHAET